MDNTFNPPWAVASLKLEAHAHGDHAGIAGTDGLPEKGRTQNAYGRTIIGSVKGIIQVGKEIDVGRYAADAPCAQ